LFQFVGNAAGTEAERSGLVEHHQLSTLVFKADGVHTCPYRFLQDAHEFLKRPYRVVGFTWHDAPFSCVRLWCWLVRLWPEVGQNYGPTSASCPGPRPGCRLVSSAAETRPIPASLEGAGAVAGGRNRPEDASWPRRASWPGR